MSVRQVIMAFSFKIDKPDDLSETLRNTAKAVRESGGTFFGDEGSGNFSASGVEGDFTVGDKIAITITKKPWYASEDTVRSKITEYFKGK
jgi:hypothetical protein